MKYKPENEQSFILLSELEIENLKVIGETKVVIPVKNIEKVSLKTKIEYKVIEMLIKEGNEYKNIIVFFELENGLIVGEAEKTFFKIVAKLQKS